MGKWHVDCKHVGIAMNSKYSTELNKLLDFSRSEATRLNSAQIEPVHLLLGLLSMNDCRGFHLLEQQGVNVNSLRSESETWIRQHVQNDTARSASLNISRRTEKVLRLTMLESMVTHSKEADTEHLLLAIMRENENEACSLLAQKNVSYNVTRNLVQGNADSTPNTGRRTAPQNGMGVRDDEEPAENPTPNDSQTDVAVADKKKSGTPMLDNFGHDLTRAAAEGLLDPLVGRDNEILRISQILSRRKKNNPILIGQPGVGKSAIVEGLAARIIKRQVTRSLFDKRIISLDLAAVVAGTKYRGQFEERIRNIVREVQTHKNIILFIDEIHTIIGAGGAAGTMDAANMLKPALARGGFQCIGATTIDEYRKSIEKDGALERRFQKVLVEPTTREETLQILHNLRERYEDHHDVRYTDEALAACVNLTERYVSDRSFPDKAIDAMDEGGARAHINGQQENSTLLELENELASVNKRKNDAVRERNFAVAAELRGQALQIAANLDTERKRWELETGNECVTVTDTTIADVVAQMTGIPVQRIGESETARLRGLKSALQTTVIGQDDAVDKITRAIQRSRIGLKDPNKPIGTFMFLGPTGVGKTYLTKQLAERMFGSQDALIRIDMSEFMEKHTVSRLVGAPPGYVGYEEGGQLTERVRRHPYSIILLDEIEKAHQDVFNILLQVMDEGRMTDGNGTTIDFKNTIIIMTSNCGSRQLKEFGQGIGFASSSGLIDNKSGRDVIQKALNKQFAPEFLNRLDEIVFFNQISREDIIRMVDLGIKPIMKRVEAMGMHLVVDDAARRFIAEKGYDAQFGARPLARALQTHIEDAICELFMNNDIALGQTIHATAEDGGIRMSIDN